jgi:hypothetical protein
MTPPVSCSPARSAVFRRGLARAILLVPLFAGRSAGQEPLPLDHFNGWENWPLLEPGDLAIHSENLSPLRIEFDGLFPGPNGFGVPPLDSLTMYIEVMEERFHGAPALWVQWTSKPRAASGGAPALDVLLVDRASFRLLFRIAASGRGDWAGRYEVIQARPEGVVQVSVAEDGASTKQVLEGAANYFDFATYQFLFPFLELREGMAFRLSGYEYLEKQAEVLPVRVVGRTNVADAHGADQAVWRVDVMPPHRATLISFYVSDEPPYFYGWDYRLTRDGSTALKLTLRGWASTSDE